MNERIDITVLAEERATNANLVAEHAWAVWIEIGGNCLLFDVGQGDEVVRNAEALKVELSKCDTIALSHGHYDHSGGLAAVLPLLDGPRVCVHPMAFDQKFAKNADGTSRNNGMPQTSRDALLGSATELIETPRPSKIGPGLWVTGEIPRRTEFEDSGGAYFTEPDCFTLDPITDDQALFFQSSRGTVVILGCAHSGVINTVGYICELVGSRKIHAILGGMHLIHASDERIESTIEALESFDFNILGLGHCTGPVASSKLKEKFGDKCTDLFAGTRLSFMMGT